MDGCTSFGLKCTRLIAGANWEVLMCIYEDIFPIDF